MRDIIQMGHPTLRKEATTVPIDEIRSSKIQKIISNMKIALASKEEGVAIAAPQINESLRMFIVSGKVIAIKKAEEYDKRKHKDAVFINPKIISKSKKTKTMHEGCLSVYGKYGEVKRHERVTIDAFDENGNKVHRGASGFLAQIFQHEVDHLNGILYTDNAIKMWEETQNRV